MADDGSVQSQNIWPISNYYFSVDIGDRTDLAFQEVSGLEIESKVIEYRNGNSPQFSTIKMPGMFSSGDVTLKKGVFVKDNNFWDWFNQIKMNTIARVPVVIKLLDEAGEPTMTWSLLNAFPSKISGVDMKSDGNEVAVETLVISHEGLTIANA
jgi:phage tail-like protein